MLLATYRLYRSNALWFSRRTDGHSITVRDGLTFKFEKGEMKRWTNYWLGRAREYWSGVHDAPTLPATESGCICPECTERMIDGEHYERTSTTRPQ